MSYTTRAFRRGSLLMEFLLVLPVYLLLMGMAFSLGEMGVKAISLAHGDRILSHSSDGPGAQSLLAMMRERLFPQDAIQYGDDISGADKQDDLAESKNTYRSDEGFQGAWSWQVAGRAGDDYALPPWTRGWLQYPHAHYSSTTGDSSGGDEGAFGDLLAVNTLGRTLIESKEVEGRIRVYNYYTLKRTQLGAQKGAFRQWKASGLARNSGASPIWRQAVQKEEYASPDGSKLDAASQGSDALPDEREGMDYDRNSQLMEWSQ